MTGPWIVRQLSLKDNSHDGWSSSCREMLYKAIAEVDLTESEHWPKLMKRPPCDLISSYLIFAEVCLSFLQPLLTAQQLSLDDLA